jgi:AraC-like DNA-binding protein
MTLVLFNMHDVMLLITIYLCVLFAIFLLTLKKGNNKSNLLLACFLLTHAAIPLDNLIMFGEVFRAKAIEFSPDIFYVFGTAYWLESVFLLFYVKSLIYKSFTLSKLDYLYFLPFIGYLIFQWVMWFSLSTEVKLDILNGYHLEEQPGYIFMVHLFRESFRVFCTVLCLKGLLQYQKQIKNEFSDIEKFDLTWLKILVIGYLVINLQSVIVPISVIIFVEFQTYIDYSLLGLVANYTALLLISVMIFFSLSGSSVFKGIDQNKLLLDDNKNPISPDLINTIVDYMKEHKPYLNHLLTLDNLSNQLLLQPRLLSQIINRHFQQNFFEFINSYRVQECKLIIEKAGNEKITMLQVMDQSGFNSKATFNTFFKKLVGMTPTQYRKEHVQS